MSHGHSHGCHHESADDENESELGILYSLYQKIDMDNLECLNEEIDGSGKNVFKSYENRKDYSKFVQSDADQELLFNIPFTGNVKLKGIRIAGADDDSHPKVVKLFKNRPKMTFEDASSKAEQEFELCKDANGDVEYPLKLVSFSSVYHLSLYFPTNYGDDITRIYYIGLRGEFSEAHHHGVTICNYEVRPNMFDHKNKWMDSVNHQIQ